MSTTRDMHDIGNTLSTGEDRSLISSNIPTLASLGSNHLSKPGPDGMREDRINWTTHLETAAAGLAYTPTHTHRCWRAERRASIAYVIVSFAAVHFRLSRHSWSSLHCEIGIILPWTHAWDGFRTHFVCIADCTLWTLWYATLLVSEVRPGVSGEAPWADGGVVWVATVVFSEVLPSEPLRHESVRIRAAVTQADTSTKTSCQTFQLACKAAAFWERKEIQGSVMLSYLYVFGWNQLTLTRKKWIMAMLKDSKVANMVLLIIETN